MAARTDMLEPAVDEIACLATLRSCIKRGHVYHHIMPLYERKRLGIHIGNH
jgi:hypothetical protein